MRPALLAPLLLALLAGCFHGAAPGPGGDPVVLPPSLPDGDRLLALVEEQVLYPNGSVRHRVPGTAGAREAADLIAARLAAVNATVRFEDFSATYRCAGPTPLRNVVGTLPGASNATVYLVAHYDTRPVADKDPDPANRTRPIPGANDGGSGVAVVLELARLLAERPRHLTYVFLLVDGEDGGAGHEGQAAACGGKWALGSQHHARALSASDVAGIRALLLFDLVGDRALELRREASSHAGPGRPIQDALWTIGGALGHASIFRNSTSLSVVDDHTAFLERNVPAVDLIHLDGGADPFPSTHHTQRDDLDHLSKESLRIVATVAWTWLAAEDGRASASA